MELIPILAGYSSGFQNVVVNRVPAIYESITCLITVHIYLMSLYLSDQ